MSSTSHNLKKKKLWTLNREMIPFKLHYFLMCGSEVGALPYLTVFAKNNLQLSATSVGVIATVTQFSLLIIKPAFGALADYSNKLKAIIVILTAFQAIALLCMLAIPKAEEPILSGTSPKPRWTTENLDSTANCIITNCNILSLPESHCAIQTGSCIDRRGLNWMNCGVRNRLTTPACDNSDQVLRFCLSYRVDGDTKDTITTSTNLKIRTESLELDALSSNSCRISVPCDLRCEREMHFCSTDDQEKNSFVGYRFWTFGFLCIISGVFINVALFLSDAGCYESLKERPDLYGKQRLWGSMAWATMGLPAGYLIDLATGDSTVVDYSPGWYMMAAFTILAILNILRIDLTKPNFSRHIFRDIKSVFAYEEFVVIEIAAFVCGLFTAIIRVYFLWYLESLGSDCLLMGLSLTVQCLFSEVPVMFFSGRIIKEMGHLNVMTLTFAFFALRFFGLFCIHDPWFGLLTQLCHGITFGLFFTALTSYAKLKAPPGTEATVQGILCATFDGLGIGVGSLLGGICYDTLGGRQTFLVAAILSACAAILNFIVTYVIFKRERKFMKMNRSVVNGNVLYTPSHCHEEG